MAKLCVKFFGYGLIQFSSLQTESVQSRKPDTSWYYDFSEPIENDRTRVSRSGVSLPQIRLSQAPLSIRRANRESW